MLKVYVHPLSGPSNKVMFGLHAMDLDYERVQVNLATGEQREDWFEALNPFGKVPVIDDDGFVLYESGAILSYLARKEKSPLYPSTYQERAIVDQWCHFSTEMLQSALQRVFFNRVLAPMIGAPVDEGSIKQGLHLLDAYLPVLDAHLGKSELVCGVALTLADLTLASVIDTAKIAQVELSGYAHISRWWQQVCAMDFYTRTHSHYGAGILDRE